MCLFVIDRDRWRLHCPEALCDGGFCDLVMLNKPSSRNGVHCDCFRTGTIRLRHTKTIVDFLQLASTVLYCRTVHQLLEAMLWLFARAHERSEEAYE